MSSRVNYELSEEDFQTLLKASKPVPYMVFGGQPPVGPQARVDAIWKRIGEVMGFDYMTVMPDPARGDKYFSARPTEAAMKEGKGNEV